MGQMEGAGQKWSNSWTSVHSHSPPLSPSSVLVLVKGAFRNGGQGLEGGASWLEVITVVCDHGVSQSAGPVYVNNHPHSPTQPWLI